MVSPDLRIQPFSIAVREEVLSDLRARIRATRWAPPAPGEPWEQGTDPRSHGIDGPAFDLVIPSLPGYGFSERPPRANYRDVAARWHRLMKGLGYERYGAGGGDFGAGVATVMALDDPQSMVAIHLSTRARAARLLGRWTPMPSGGHFAPREEPELLARDVCAFFGGL